MLPSLYKESKDRNTKETPTVNPRPKLNTNLLKANAMVENEETEAESWSLCCA